MKIINQIKNLFMPKAKKVVEEKVQMGNVAEDGGTTAHTPAGFNETTGEKLTKESFQAYIDNMKKNEPQKYAKKKDELEKKLASLEE